jgi:hypothetical protein
MAQDFSPKRSEMWQIPVGLQILWAGLLGLGMLTLRESTRWLVAAGRHEEAWHSLKWIRADDGPLTVAEFAEIREYVDREENARRGFRLVEMLQGSNLQRTVIASAVFVAQQATGKTSVVSLGEAVTDDSALIGATAFAYYGPQVGFS